MYIKLSKFKYFDYQTWGIIKSLYAKLYTQKTSI